MTSNINLQLKARVAELERDAEQLKAYLDQARILLDITPDTGDVCKAIEDLFGAADIILKKRDELVDERLEMLNSLVKQLEHREAQRSTLEAKLWVAINIWEKHPERMTVEYALELLRASREVLKRFEG